jgi:ribulose kinase
LDKEVVCAVDVGTTSARAGIFDRNGRQLGRAEHPILVHQPQADHAEHDSEDIWSAVCVAVRAACRNAGIDPLLISGLCFDATCSLVVRGGNGDKVSVSADGDRRWDTISWFDHRAIAEADECTATRHPILDHAGGVMSPEMQMPKLMWLKRHHPTAWEQAGHLFDLADFLTWRATGNEARSQCTLTCKWTYMPHDGGWRQDFLDAIGLSDLRRAAGELGVSESCVVATGLIDAYAGMLGVIGAYGATGASRHLALIAGTSSCVMWFSKMPDFVPGFWGPYLGAALPELWVGEGGQSATGALLDHLLQFHRHGGETTGNNHARIIDRIQALRAADPGFGDGLHVLPDFNGNRSPLADPHSGGVIHGLRLDSSYDGLCALYWRTCVAIALGVRHIIDHLHAKGQTIEHLHVTGGHLRNPLLMELYADATGVPIVTTAAEDAVLLGSSMVAASAAGWYPNLGTTCRQMQQPERIRQPDPQHKGRYDRDYRAFLALHRQQGELREIIGRS